MLISVVNHTKGKLSDEQSPAGDQGGQPADCARLRAPTGISRAELRLEGTDWRTSPMTRGSCPSCAATQIIYLWDEVDVEDALGYHES